MSRITVGISLVLAGLLVGGLFFRGFNAAGQGDKGDKKDGDAASAERRMLNTSGSATVRVKSDSARLYLTVETTAPTLAEARAKNNDHAKKVLDTVQGLKIPALKMKSTDVHIAIMHSHDDKKDELPRVLGYRVTNAFTVLVTNDDPAKLGAQASLVLDTAIESGANILETIHFFKQDMTAAKREALMLASKDAVANARALAAGAERTLTDILTIALDSNYRESMPTITNSIAYTAMGKGATPIVAGDLEVTCSVSMTCAYGAGKN